MSDARVNLGKDMCVCTVIPKTTINAHSSLRAHQYTYQAIIITNRILSYICFITDDRTYLCKTAHFTEYMLFVSKS